MGVREPVSPFSAAFLLVDDQCWSGHATANEKGLWHSRSPSLSFELSQQITVAMELADC